MEMKIRNVVILSLSILMLVGLGCVSKYVLSRNESFASQDINITSTDEIVQMSSNDVFYIKCFADWCPHCKNMETAWNTLHNKYNGTTVNGKRVFVKQMQDTNQNLSKFKSEFNVPINGFPTILRVYGGSGLAPIIDQYTGERGIEALSLYIDGQ